MLILALDSSGKSLALALREESKLIAERYFNLGYTHSETLMPQLLSMLEDTDKDFQDLDALAVSQGPGSYTGIRIGLTTMKSLAFALNIPLFAFSSLDILRESYVPLNLFILSSIDAQRDRCYASCYKGDKVVLPEGNRTVQETLDDLKELFYVGRKDVPTLYLCGDASKKILATAAEDPELNKHFNLTILDPSLEQMRAANLARLTEEKYVLGERPTWAEAKANYASPTQAERVRKAYLQSLKLRPACEDDLDTLHKIERICFPTPWSKKALAHQVSQENKDAHLYLIYEEKGEGDTQSEEVLGYGGFYRHIDEGDVLNIAVLPEYRRKGIGRKLLQYLLSEAERMGIQRLILEVRKSNKAAQALYRSLGFKECGRRKNYYDKPREDALLMDRQ